MRMQFNVNNQPLVQLDMANGWTASILPITGGKGASCVCWPTSSGGAKGYQQDAGIIEADSDIAKWLGKVARKVTL